MDADDRRPVPPKARAAFYAALLLHANLADTSLHESVGEWCNAPRSLLLLDGAKRYVEAAAYLCLRDVPCDVAQRIAQHVMSALLAIAAIASLTAARAPSWWPLSRAPPCAVACCMSVLECLHESLRRSSKRWLLPTYTCVVLALDVAGAPSVEARLVCTDAASAIMAAAFLSKLTLGRGLYPLGSAWPTLTWAHGGSLPGGVLAMLSHVAEVLRVEESALRTIAASGTLACEGLGLIHLLTPRQVRAPLTRLVACAYAALHLGILASEQIDYRTYILVYAAVLWPSAAAPEKRPTPTNGARHRTRRRTRLSASSSPEGSWSGRSALACACHRAIWSVTWTVLVLGPLAAAVCAVDPWPLTGVAMYSFARDDTWRTDCLTDEQAMTLESEAHGSLQSSWAWFGVEEVLHATEPAAERPLLVRRSFRAAAVSPQSVVGKDATPRLPSAYMAHLLNAFASSMRDETMLPDDGCVSAVERRSAPPAEHLLRKMLPLLRSSRSRVGLELYWRSCRCGRQLLAAVTPEGDHPACSVASRATLDAAAASRTGGGANLLALWCAELRVPSLVNYGAVEIDGAGGGAALLAEPFLRFDTAPHDGVLSACELYEMIVTTHGGTPTAEEVGGVLAELDKDGDGAISAAESHMVEWITKEEREREERELRDT